LFGHNAKFLNVNDKADDVTIT